MGFVNEENNSDIEKEIVKNVLELSKKFNMFLQLGIGPTHDE